MNPLIIKGTDRTLDIKLDKNSEVFEFTGKSRPEDTVVFFEPVFKWFEEYIKNPLPETTIKFNLEYFNSSTAKVLLRLLVKFEDYASDGHNINIHWYYRSMDEDMLESGEDFDSLVDISFEFYEV